MIHPTAIVDPAARLADDVTVGPFAMIEAEVEVGAGTVVYPRAYIGRGTVLGPGNVVHIGAVLGRAPDHRAPGADRDVGVRLVVGARNEFRENSTVLHGHAEVPTRIGDDNYVMGGARIGAGAVLGNGVTVAPYVVVSQDAEIGDRAFISGNVVVHPGVRVGRLAFVSGLSAVHRDAPPFMMVGGRPAVTMAPNMKGLQRAGLAPEAREAIKQAYKRLFRPDAPPDDALTALEAADAIPELRELAAFVRSSRDVRAAVEDQLNV